MKKFNLLISIMIALALVGCVNDFLDRDIDDNYSEDQVFSSYTTMRNFGIGVYNYLPHGFDRFNGAMLASATDDAVHSGANRTIERLSDGSWGEFNNPDDQWDNLFAGIRKANLFLEKSEDYREIVLRDTVTEGGKQDYLNQTNDLMWLRAETRILRAYFYFELAKRYGGVPLITQPLSPNGDIYRSRDSFDETVDFIVNEIDEARGDLRDTWVGFSGSNWVGRVTDGVALSLKSRTLLYAASPLNNPSGDNQKWIDAAAAAHDVMELNQYSLSDNYKGLFRTIQDDEIILARWYEASNTFERSSYPVGFEGSAGGVNPTQNLVDAYETTNGLSVHEDPAYDPQDPYSNRDPRLQMNIIVNNAAYKGREVEIWDGGSDGPGRSRATRTG
ncbi:MAG: RagB/SusD family nutrient uptake outer membrane protein, partial [Balneolales bacterium]